MIPPRDEWTSFHSDEETLNYLKEHGLTPKSASAPRALVYSGVYTNSAVLCKIVGHTSDQCAVISIDDELHCIDVNYLLEMQSSRPMVAFDVETPNSSNDRISEIGLAQIIGGQVVKTACYLINPEVPFDQFNTKLTGISADTVADAPTLPQIWPTIERFLSGAVLVAHNAAFDLSVLYKALSVYGIPFPPAEYLCTMTLSKKVLPELPHHDLRSLCDHYKIELEHHKAGSDALACAKILLELQNSKVQTMRYIREYTPGEKTATGGKQQDIDNQESIRLMSPALPLSERQVSIPLDGKSICLTGEFVCAGRTELSGYLAQMGAIVQKGVTRKTDYLIVGRNGSDLWSEKTCGTKEKRARELQEQGFPIQIISESDLFIEEGVPV